MLRRPLLAAALSSLAASMAVPAAAQQAEVPYWASLDDDEAYMRAGPAPRFQIKWVYARKGLPVKVLRVNHGYRYVEEPDGTRGWMSATLLTRERGAIVIGEGVTALRAEPGDGSELRWNVEPGVVGKLGDCQANWCEFDVGGRAGWIAQERLWGAGEP